MATAAKNTPESEVGIPEPETTEEKIAIAGKVDLITWQKLKYLSLKRSMQSGQNITMSKTIGDLLEKVAENLEEPPADLVS